jgi:hypothetical protein
MPYFVLMASNTTPQGLTNADIWVLQQLIIKSNDIQLGIAISLIENEISKRKLIQEDNQ